MKKLLIILLLPLSLYSQTRVQIDSLRYYIHHDLNEYRLKYNLDTLELLEDINQKAQEHAEWMYNTERFEHSKKYIENIQYGSDKIFTLKLFSYWTLQGWKESPGHNRQMLWEDYKKVGYGFYKGYAVMMFEYGIYTGI